MVKVRMYGAVLLRLNSLNKIYQTLLPEFIRKPLWKLRKSIPIQIRELRWNIASNRYLQKWTEKRLELGDFYWLFILGCNNSGTTLLTQILESHPLVRSLPKEGQRITKAIPNSAKLGIGRVFTQGFDLLRWTEESDAHPISRLKYDWAAQFSGKPPGILLEKSPPNSIRSRWLQKHFFPCRFITLVRNPYAVCEGINRRRGHTIEEAARHWRCVYDIIKGDSKYLKKNLIVRYEDLCDDLDKTLSIIENFLDLETALDRSLITKDFNVHNMDGGSQKIKNFNEKSFKRLSPQQVKIITSIIGEQMTKFGYQPLSILV